MTGAIYIFYLVKNKPPSFSCGPTAVEKRTNNLFLCLFLFMTVYHRHITYMIIAPCSTAKNYSPFRFSSYSFWSADYMRFLKHSFIQAIQALFTSWLLADFFFQKISGGRGSGSNLHIAWKFGGKRDCFHRKVPERYWQMGVTHAEREREREREIDRHEADPTCTHFSCLMENLYPYIKYLEKSFLENGPPSRPRPLFLFPFSSPMSSLSVFPCSLPLFPSFYR